MSSDPHNLVGVTLAGRYRIEKPIGEGGMGAIFLATQLSLGRPVAIKVVKPAAGVVGATPHDENMKRFERETEVIARLAHPNIVQVVDAGRADDGTLFLAMELLEGDNVRQVLRRELRIDVARALAIVEDVASALVAAHQGGVIHRDLKCENVMLVRAAGKDETAKVLDFGVAKLTSPTAAPMTGSGFVAGTPGCIAPEQMLGKTDDPRSDLYSLGVMLFEMLSGQPPFTGGSAMEVMLKHLQEPAPKVSDVARQFGAGEIPLALDALVASLLAKDPTQRPPDALALRDIIRSMRDAGRATAADIPRSSFPNVALGTPIGSRVVVGPSLTPSTSPTTHLPGTPPVVAPSSSPVVVARRNGPPRVVRIAAAVVVLGLVAFFGCRQYAKWSANATSQVPAAKAAIARATEDLWNLDLDKVDVETQAAISADKDAPWAHLLRAAQLLVDRRPLSRVDAEILVAKAAADRRASMMVERTATAGLIGVLSIADPLRIDAAATDHCTTFNMCSQLDAALITLKVVASSGEAEQVAHGAKYVGSERPLSLFIQAILEEKRAGEAKDEAERASHLEAAFALLQKAEQLAPGRPTIVDALANIELLQGKRSEAEARLEKVAARSDKIAIRLATLKARDGDKDAFNGVIGRVENLPQHDELRVDELASIGMHFASLGRFTEAEKFWKESIDDRDRSDAVANARALELASTAVLFGLVAGDRAIAERWSEQLNALPRINIAGADRIATFNLAANALVQTFGNDLVRAKESLSLLEQTPTDIPVLITTVRFYIALSEKKLDEADNDADHFSPCFVARNKALVALMRNDPAKAKQLLDDGLSESMARRCTTGDETIRYIEQVSWAQAIAERATLALKSGDRDGAKAYLTAFHRYWPHADSADLATAFNPDRLMGRFGIAALEKTLSPTTTPSPPKH